MRGAADPSCHFLGVQVADAHAFEPLPDGIASELRQVVMGHPGRIRAQRVHAEFLDIGTPGDYLETSLRIGRREGSSNQAVRARVHPTARVEDSVLWDEVTVGAGSFLRECIVLDGTQPRPKGAER